MLRKNPPPEDELPDWEDWEDPIGLEEEGLIGEL
jgi:hypothetical protein